MDKKFLLICVYIFSISLGNAQNFFSEQEENIVYYSPDIAPAAVCVDDLDGDGNIDILSFFNKKFRFYKHSNIKGTLNELEIISAPEDWILSLRICDLNGDGRKDILAASYNNDKIIWFENNGNETFGDQQVITDSTVGAISVFNYDLDKDGDQDVLSASLWDNKIAWYENDGKGNFREQQIICNQAEGARYVYVSDLNNDSLPDVLSASIYDNKLAWYENQGNGIFGEKQVIADSLARPICIYTSDIDGDNIPDVLSATSWDNNIAWYKNDGKGNFGSQQVISSFHHEPQSVYAADLDGDNDQDVISASLLDNKIAWYENDGNGNFGSQQVVTNNADMPGYVYAGDIDGDGYKDIVSASTDFKIAWYKNTLPLKINGNPKDTIVFPNKVATFSVIAESAAVFQWQCKDANEFYDLSNDEIYTGVNTNTLTLTDASFNLQKNQYRCLLINGTDSLITNFATLTIKDTIHPIITSILNDTIIHTDKHCIAILPDYMNIVEANDNSMGTLIITQTPVPWSKIYSTQEKVTIKVSDEAGNSNKISFNVNIADSIPPIISVLQEKYHLKDNGNGQFIIPDLKDKINVTDNCNEETSIVVSQEPAAGSIVAESEISATVIIEATDESGNRAHISIVAHAQDTIPPLITSSHNNLSLEANHQCQAFLPNYRGKVTATDNVNKATELSIRQTPAPYTFISGSNNVVTLTVTDKSNNSSEVSFNVQISDTRNPELKCPQHKNIVLELGQSTYTVSGNEFDPVSITDNCEILSIKNNLNDSSSLSQYIFSTDTNNVEWTVTDNGGNVAQCNFNVVINKAVSINYIRENGINVYPNPTTGIIRFESHKIVHSIGVFDMSGNQILAKEYMNKTGKIDLSNCPSANYIVNIRTNTKVFNLTIVKE